MQGEPSYKIKYMDCSEAGHEGEKINLVCLNVGCFENSLICSLCTTQQHQGHVFKPLKFYLDELHKQYRSGPSKFEEQIE